MGNKYDVIIVGAGPGGIFSAYELVQKAPNLKVAVFELVHFPMVNIILRMILVELYTNMLASKRQQN